MRSPTVAIYRDDDRLTGACRQILDALCRIRVCRRETEALLAAGNGEAAVLVTDFEVAGRSAHSLVSHVWSLRQDAQVVLVTDRSVIPMPWVEHLMRRRSNLRVVSVQPGTADG